MKHKGHERFIAGVPTWSKFKRYPVVWCDNCQRYQVDRWFYFKSLLWWESKNLNNRFYYLKKFFIYRLCAWLIGDDWIDCPYCGKEVNKKKKPWRILE
jgi:hypothetical protein